MKFVLLLALLTVVIVFTSLGTSGQASKIWMFFRSFFPSWRFFEDVEHRPVLLVRTANDPDHFGPWQSVTPPIARSATQLVFSPQGNLYHAYTNHLRSLLDEIQHSPSKTSIVDSTAYRLTRNLAQFELRQRSTTTNHRYLQFKVSVLSPLPGQDEPQDVLISPVYEV